VAPIDITALRDERSVRRGHHMLAHLRTEAYPGYQSHRYPPSLEPGTVETPSYERNNLLIDESKRQIADE